MNASPQGRTIKTGQSAVLMTSHKEVIGNLEEWMVTKAKDYSLTTLLAFLDDGVVWGKFDAGGWITSDRAGVGLPKLRLAALQELRLFGPECEVLLYRVEEGEFHLRMIEDKPSEKPDYTEYFDELQFLWGTNSKPGENGFTILTEGNQGLLHAVPLAVTLKDDQGRHPRLRVRHYLNPASEPLAQVSASRCVSLELDKEG